MVMLHKTLAMGVLVFVASAGASFGIHFALEYSTKPFFHPTHVFASIDGKSIMPAHDKPLRQPYHPTAGLGWHHRPDANANGANAGSG